MLTFEWDAPKSTGNLRKHGVCFEEAASVFGEPLALTFTDPDHSLREARLITIEQSYQDLLIGHRAHRTRPDNPNHPRTQGQQTRANDL
jgi:uncharacterized protein